MSHPSVPRIVDRTGPCRVCSRPPRDRDACANAHTGHRNRPATSVADLSADLRAVQDRDRRGPSASRRSRAGAARSRDAIEHGARHRRTGLRDPGRRGLPANARRGRHLRIAVPAEIADAVAARARRRPCTARRTRRLAPSVGHVARRSACAAPAANRRRDERRAASVATRGPGARRISAQGVAPARVAARAQRRTRAARLPASVRLPAAARTHRHLSGVVARRRLRAGTGVHHQRLPCHAGTRAAQPRASGRPYLVRGPRLSARTQLPVRDRCATRPGAGGRRRDRRRARHAPGRAGTLRAGDAVASEPARAHAVAVPTHRIAGLGRKNVGLDRRGRLRQRVSLSRPPAAGAEESRPAGSRGSIAVPSARRCTPVCGLRTRSCRSAR